MTMPNIQRQDSKTIDNENHHQRALTQVYYSERPIRVMTTCDNCQQHQLSKLNLGLAPIQGYWPNFIRSVPRVFVNENICRGNGVGGPARGNRFRCLRTGEVVPERITETDCPTSLEINPDQIRPAKDRSSRHTYTYVFLCDNAGVFRPQLGITKNGSSCATRTLSGSSGDALLWVSIRCLLA